MKIFFFPKSHQPSELTDANMSTIQSFSQTQSNSELLFVRFVSKLWIPKQVITRKMMPTKISAMGSRLSGTTMSKTFFAVRLIKLTQFCQKHNSLIAESEYIISQSSVVLSSITSQKVFRLRGD